MEDNNNLPPIRTPEEIKLDSIRPYLLDARKDYPDPYYMLEFNGVPFSAIGGIQAITGQKKNGKSFVLTQLMAAILGQNSERVGLYLPGLQVPERTLDYLGHYPKVLYCDTEMEELNSAKVLRRVHWLCDWNMRENHERFNVLWLKNMPNDDVEKAHIKRFHIIKDAIDIFKPDIVFVDGLRDLLSSINDEETAVEILGEMGALCEERHICIWNALHQNPKAKSDGEDSKMRGWVGTELGNKASDTLASIKSKTVNGVSFTVKQLDARGKDIDDWKFEVVDDAGNLGIPKIINRGFNLSSKSKEQPTCDDIVEVRTWIEQATGMLEWPMTRADVKKKIFGDIGGQKNKDKQQADLIAALNMGYLEESTIKANGYYMLQPPEDMPF